MFFFRCVVLAPVGSFYRRAWLIDRAFDIHVHDAVIAIVAAPKNIVSSSCKCCDVRFEVGGPGMQVQERPGCPGGRARLGRA
eukprot:6420848-Pyramimonas_sp.AAC.1